MDPEEILQRINTAKTDQEVAELYDKWAKSYDPDLEQLRPGNEGANRTIEWFVQYVPTDAKVLDAGSGYRWGRRTAAPARLSQPGGARYFSGHVGRSPPEKDLQ